MNVLLSKRRSLVIMFFYILFSGIGNCQNKIDGFAINPKMGLFLGSANNMGIVAGVEANVLKNSIIYSLAYCDSEVITLSNSTPTIRYNQLDMMLGKYVDYNYFRFLYQAGLGAFWGVNQGELISEGGGLFPDNIYEEVPFYTLGIPLKIGVKVIPLKFLSIGFELQANINTENTIVMPMISIEIGRIRD